MEEDIDMMRGARDEREVDIMNIPISIVLLFLM